MYGIGSKGYRANYLSVMMLWRGKLLHTGMRHIGMLVASILIAILFYYAHYYFTFCSVFIRLYCRVRTAKFR